MSCPNSSLCYETENKEMELVFETISSLSIKDKDSGLIAPDHSIGDTLYIDEGGVITEILITNVEYLSGDLEPTYTVVNKVDGSNERKIL